MSNLPYDPDLKEAMERIKAIMDEYQVGGSIILSSRTHSEFLTYFPGWSIAQFNEDNTGINIRSKREDFDSREHQEQVTQDTVGFLCHIRDISAHTFGIFQDTVEKISEYFEIDHTPFEGITQSFNN